MCRTSVISILLPSSVIPQLSEGDLVITLGAGSVTRLSEEILEKLSNKKTEVKALGE